MAPARETYSGWFDALERGALATKGGHVRTDGGNWLTDGFVVGQRVTINGTGPWTIVGMFDDDDNDKENDIWARALLVKREKKQSRRLSLPRPLSRLFFGDLLWDRATAS